MSPKLVEWSSAVLKALSRVADRSKLVWVELSLFESWTELFEL
jgi:hypothetical protein